MVGEGGSSGYTIFLLELELLELELLAGTLSDSGAWY